MALFNITVETPGNNGSVLKIGFGDPAQNDAIVRFVKERMDVLTADGGELTGGSVLRINGPASLPVAVVITHAVAHRYGAIAVFDPKLNKYVVSISHDPSFTVGDLID